MSNLPEERQTIIARLRVNMPALVAEYVHEQNRGKGQDSGLTFDDLREATKDALGYGKRSNNQPIAHVAGQLHYCPNHHPWHDPEKAAKCCQPGWRQIRIPTGQTLPDGSEIWERDFVRDFEGLTPPADELIDRAKKLHRHSLGDEFFKGAK